MIYDQTECSLTKWSKEQETDLFIAFSSFMTNRSWFLGLILSGVVIYLLFKKNAGFYIFGTHFLKYFDSSQIEGAAAFLSWDAAHTLCLAQLYCTVEL